MPIESHEITIKTPEKVIINFQKPMNLPWKSHAHPMKNGGLSELSETFDTPKSQDGPELEEEARVNGNGVLLRFHMEVSSAKMGCFISKLMSRSILDFYF